LALLDDLGEQLLADAEVPGVGIMILHLGANGLAFVHVDGALGVELAVRFFDVGNGFLDMSV